MSVSVGVGVGVDVSVGVGELTLFEIALMNVVVLPVVVALAVVALEPEEPLEPDELLVELLVPPSAMVVPPFASAKVKLACTVLAIVPMVAVDVK
jgi:hypothetical protein